MRETLDHRCLGALEFIDALTGARVRSPLRLASATLRLRPNAAAAWVIHGARGHEDEMASFAPPVPAVPPEPPTEHLLAISDPERRYLPRLLRLNLPRAQTALSDPASVLRAVPVALYPSGARPVEPHWAVLRASVWQTVDGQRLGLGNAWLTLTPALPGIAPVHALTDAQGEALLALAGVPPVRPVPGPPADPGDPDPPPVYRRDFDATLRVVLHPDVVYRADAPGPVPLADPDRIERDIALAAPGLRTLNPPLGPLAPGALRRVQVEVLP